MVRKFTGLLLPGLLLALFSQTPALAGVIGYTINGGALQFGVVDGGGNTFNTGGNTTCGLAAACAESDIGFTINDLASGITVGGNFTFTTVDNGVNTTAAIEQLTNLVIDNTNAINTENIVMYFFSDSFDPSLAGLAGVGEFGSFQSDLGAGFPVNAAAQAQMNYLTGGFATPGVGSFSLTTPSIFVNCGGCSPTGFWSYVQVAGNVVGINALVGAFGATMAPDSEVVMPGSMIVEDDDTSALEAEVPEPGSLLLLGAGLAAVGSIRRRKVA